MSREDVNNAFEIILGRPPYDEAEISYHSSFPSKTALCEFLFATQEFRNRIGPLLYARNAPLWVEAEIMNGLRLWLDLNDIGVSVPCLQEAYEPPITDFILSQLKPGDVFIDAGANIGWFTLLAARQLGVDGRVHAFEPASETFHYLQRSVDSNGFAGRCHLYQKALGAASGVGRIVQSSNSHNRGHAHLAYDGASAGTEITDEELSVVEICQLDDIPVSGPVKLMKIDVEGAEALVIAGAAHTIARDQPMIIAEVFPAWLRRISGLDGAGFISQMAALGYQPYAIGHAGGITPYSLLASYEQQDEFYTTLAFLTQTHTGETCLLRDNKMSIR